MCGIAALVGPDWRTSQLSQMTGRQAHRGPDGSAIWEDSAGLAGLGHTRLSIIDPSAAGAQPMADASGRYWTVFNGEIYNFLELRDELRSSYAFRTESDTEVLLAAYDRWDADCLHHLLGMFAFAIWDRRERVLFAARDRFGVKPLHLHTGRDGTLLLASEIKALHAAGVPAIPDAVAWATYLATGQPGSLHRTFWTGIESLPAGHSLEWRDGQTRIARWYDLAERAGSDYDLRPESVVREEYLAGLTESVRLRFRSDVPVGLSLSGGLDSSLLVALVERIRGGGAQHQRTQIDRDVRAYTFVTGDAAYDETPWVQRMLARTSHQSVLCPLRPDEVPDLAASLQAHEDEPFGGLPTVAYARLFEQARQDGVTVLLDGQGLDEQWAGYDYYASAGDEPASIVQGAKSPAVHPQCLVPEFRALAEPVEASSPFPDRLRNLQYRDAVRTKLPRALRYNDRASMRASCELREPFLDHRLFELALRQPGDRKIRNGTGKWLLRQMAHDLLPADLVLAPKRAVQTPQREWLRGPLRDWAASCIDAALDAQGGAWLDPEAVNGAWQRFCAGDGDNSHHIWQWISLGLMMQPSPARA